LLFRLLVCFFFHNQANDTQLEFLQGFDRRAFCVDFIKPGIAYASCFLYDVVTFKGVPEGVEGGTPNVCAFGNFFLGVFQFVLRYQEVYYFYLRAVPEDFSERDCNYALVVFISNFGCPLYWKILYIIKLP
jgi:hypothetical protein